MTALMKLADGQIRDAEESRKLQEQLVRERLKARGNRGSDKPKAKDDEVKMPEGDDLIPLRVCFAVYNSVTYMYMYIYMYLSMSVAVFLLKIL